ncbi:hypothetical protein GCM10012284_32440 [Mangrovihabitans endophyticus]|uniref:Uncharacterized protein n=1 Tax=Mangrovihabitans endophyticus TaxID=1751298 RepID=A0A8J3C1I2_9ACTN|nr:hypothetical protein GCM10012284_32440 [Mangrovihabitans endophyticus]
MAAITGPAKPAPVATDQAIAAAAPVTTTVRAVSAGAPVTTDWIALRSRRNRLPFCAHDSQPTLAFTDLMGGNIRRCAAHAAPAITTTHTKAAGSFSTACGTVEFAAAATHMTLSLLVPEWAGGLARPGGRAGD